MDAFLIAHEPQVRLAVFAGLLAVFSLAEAVRPARARTGTRWRRWPAHLLLSGLNTAALRLFGPFLAVGAAAWASVQGIGLLNWIPVSAPVAWIVALLVLDAAIWAQHLVVHKVPLFWRFHRIHHADTDVDATTALRFHPVEILASMALKVALVVALGAPAGAVILFEVILNGMAMFNHANLALPKALERPLRWFVVTPDMHRIHHSVRRAEHDTNFGFNLSVWDRLFGTYTAAPSLPEDRFPIGLEDLRDPARAAGLGVLLAGPFRAELGGASGAPGPAARPSP